MLLCRVLDADLRHVGLMMTLEIGMLWFVKWWFHSYVKGYDGGKGTQGNHCTDGWEKVFEGDFL